MIFSGCCFQCAAFLLFYQTSGYDKCYFCIVSVAESIMGETIINKVAESGLVTLDLEQYYPREEVVLFDLKGFLFMELILKEKDFREALKKWDWEIYRDKNVGVVCTADAIIPPWAYMLAASYLQPVAKDVVMGDKKEVNKIIFLKNIQRINVSEFTDQRIVIKGCGETPIEEFAYMEITKLLRPVAKTIMYGEPCSTVPIYKKKE
jgi:hypothetical protein